MEIQGQTDTNTIVHWRFKIISTSLKRQVSQTINKTQGENFSSQSTNDFHATKSGSQFSVFSLSDFSQ